MPARQAKVDVLDSSGTSLGQTVTDAQGPFVFQAQVRPDHRLVVVLVNQGACHLVVLGRHRLAQGCENQHGSRKGDDFSEITKYGTFHMAEMALWVLTWCKVRFKGCFEQIKSTNSGLL